MPFLALLMAFWLGGASQVETITDDIDPVGVSSIIENPDPIPGGIIEGPDPVGAGDRKRP